MQKSGLPEGPGGAGRLLSLDLGAKRVGVAVCDEMRLTVRALPAIRRSNWKSLVSALAELCEEFDVKGVVVGLPTGLDGGEGEAALEARRVARNLELSLGRPVVLQDEKLSSVEAEEALRDEGFRGDEIKARVDGRAAAIILRDYLARCERLGEVS